MESSESWLGIPIVMLGIGFFIYGLYNIIILVKQYRIEAEEARYADKTNAASSANLPGSKYVLITGKIAESSISDELSKLVIFRQEKWLVHKDHEYNTWHGRWHKEKEVFPAFNLQLDNGQVMFNANLLTHIGYEQQVFDVYNPKTGKLVNNIYEGTIRHVGFKAGDEISALGKKGVNRNIHGANNEENITPLAIVGGSRKRLLEYFDELINKTQNIGYATTICGIIITIYGLYMLR